MKVIMMVEEDDWTAHREKFSRLGVKVYQKIPDYLWTNILTLIQKTLKIGAFKD